MKLIIMSNKNEKTFIKVIYVIAERLKLEEKHLKEIIILDMLEESLNYNLLVSQTIGKGPKISLMHIEAEKVAIEIPKLIAEELKLHNVKEYMVDITNGTKEHSATLYATASLLRIPIITSISFNPSSFEKAPQEVLKDEYEVKELSHIENDRSLTQAGLFDIIYYHDAIKNFINSINMNIICDKYLQDNLESDIEHILTHYFNGNYSDTISRIGILTESILSDICRLIKIRAKINQNFKSSAKDKIGWLRAEFGEPLRHAISQDPSLSSDLAKPWMITLYPLVSADIILDQLRVYRNLSSHPNIDGRGEDQATFGMQTFVYMLKMIQKSGLFNDIPSH